MKGYYKTNKKYLAEALSFLGFKYYKFNDYDNENKKVYCFVNSTILDECVRELYKMKQKVRCEQLAQQYE